LTELSLLSEGRKMKINVRGDHDKIK